MYYVFVSNTEMTVSQAFRWSWFARRIVLKANSRANRGWWHILISLNKDAASFSLLGPTMKPSARKISVTAVVVFAVAFAWLPARLVSGHQGHADLMTTLLDDNDHRHDRVFQSWNASTRNYMNTLVEASIGDADQVWYLFAIIYRAMCWQSAQHLLRTSLDTWCKTFRMPFCPWPLGDYSLSREQMLRGSTTPCLFGVNTHNCGFVIERYIMWQCKLLNSFHNASWHSVGAGIVKHRFYPDAQDGYVSESKVL